MAAAGVLRSLSSPKPIPRKLRDLPAQVIGRRKAEYAVPKRGHFASMVAEGWAVLTDT